MAAFLHPITLTRLLWFGVAIVTGKAALSLRHIISTTAPDFTFYYRAAQEVTVGSSAPLHLLPPASVLVYWPVGLLPYAFSQGLWVILSFLSLIAVVLICGRAAGFRKPITYAVFASLVFVSFPARFTLGMGQVNLIALLCVIVGFGLDSRNRPVAGGVAFALAVLLKPELIILGLVPVLYRRWPMVAALSLVLASAVVGSVILWGTDVYVRYASRIQPVFAGGEDLAVYYNQGVSGVFARMGITDSLPLLLVSVLVLFVSAYHMLRRRAPYRYAPWVFMPAFILAEPIAWQHHIVFLIPSYLYVFVYAKTLVKRLLLAISYLLVSWNFAAPGFLGTMPVGWLIASHATVGVLILWGLLLSDS